VKFKLLDDLIYELAKFPGIGPKSAGRLAFYLLELHEHNTNNLVQSILKFKREVSTCPVCGCIAQNNECPICIDSSRDASIYCVVETIRDLITIERTGGHKGVYQVLGGSLAPLDGIGPDDLQIKQLLQRIENSETEVKEVILATNPTLEGEATANFLNDVIKKNNPKLLVTRIAHGIQTGGELEFADAITLSKSLSDRRIIN